MGGAERVLVDLTNKLCEDYEITILTIYDNGELKKQLDKKIKTISLYNKSYNEYSKIQHLKISLSLIFKTKVKGDYDTIVSFLEGPITRLFSKKTKKNVNKIAWVHNDISKVFGQGIKAKIKRHVDKKMYEKYDKIIFVSEENRRDFDELYKLSSNDIQQKDYEESVGYNSSNLNDNNIVDKENKILRDVKNLLNNTERLPRELVIRNYLDYERVIEKSKENIELPYNNENINIVSVCRLVEQKAIDRLIKVAGKLKKDEIKCKFYIVGDGPLKENLQKQIVEAELIDTFYLLGAKKNPYPYIKNADYFCLLSYYEGYGMVIDEAKILEKNIIITKTAAVESIEKYKNAEILENSEDGIYEGLKKILLESISNK